MTRYPVPTYKSLQKGFQDPFILFRSWVIENLGFCECVETRPFFIWTTYSRSNQSKTNLDHPFQYICKFETCGKIQQKLLNSKVVRTCQSFEFFM